MIIKIDNSPESMWLEMIKPGVYGEEYILMTPNELVPKNHLLRKIKENVDFEFIEEITAPYYILALEKGFTKRKAWQVIKWV